MWLINQREYTFDISDPSLAGQELSFSFVNDAVQNNLPNISNYYKKTGKEGEANANIKIKVGSLVNQLTIGGSYYLETSGYSGCVVVISETNTNLQFNSSNLTNMDDCADCLEKLQIVCPLSMQPNNFAKLSYFNMAI